MTYSVPTSSEKKRKHEYGFAGFSALDSAAAIVLSAGIQARS